MKKLQRLTRATQKRHFEVDLKLVIRKYYELGNDALDLDGGDPGDFGFINDDDMVKILGHAYEQMKSPAPADYLYYHAPLPRPVPNKRKKIAMTKKAGA